MEWPGNTTIFQNDGKASVGSGSAPTGCPSSSLNASILSEWRFIVGGWVEIGWVDVEWHENGTRWRHNNLPAWWKCVRWIRFSAHRISSWRSKSFYYNRMKVYCWRIGGNRFDMGWIAWKWKEMATQQSSSMMEQRPADQVPRPKDNQLMVEKLQLSKWWFIVSWKVSWLSTRLTRRTRRNVGLRTWSSRQISNESVLIYYYA